MATRTAMRALVLSWLVAGVVPCVAQEATTDRTAMKILRAARSLVQEESWDFATKALQALLDRPQDGLVEVTRPGADKPILITARAEAEWLIQHLPPAGMQFYEKQYGPDAAQKLKEAKAFKADDLLQETARRFRYTKSGVEATEMLATSLLTDGKPKEAVPYFERLLAWPGPDEVAPHVLFEAALSLRRAGDRTRSEEVWKLLVKRAGKDGVRIRDRTESLDTLRKRLEQEAP